MKNPEGCFDSLLDEILEERVSSSRGKRKQRAVKRKMKGWPIKKSGKVGKIDPEKAIEVLNEQY